MVLVKPRKNKTNFCYCLSIFLVCLIFTTGFFCIFQTTSSVTAGIKNYSQTEKINELKLANELLNEKINSLENLDSIKNRAKELGLVAVAQVEYLENQNNEVALVK